MIPERVLVGNPFARKIFRLNRRIRSETFLAIPIKLCDATSATRSTSCLPLLNTDIDWTVELSRHREAKGRSARDRRHLAPDTVVVDDVQRTEDCCLVFGRDNENSWEYKANKTLDTTKLVFV